LVKFNIDGDIYYKLLYKVDLLYNKTLLNRNME